MCNDDSTRFANTIKKTNPDMWGLYRDLSLSYILVNIVVSGGNTRHHVKFVAEVFDMAGRKLLMASLKSGDNTLSMQKLAPGSYLVQISRDGKVQTIRNIIKQ